MSFGSGAPLDLPHLFSAAWRLAATYIWSYDTYALVDVIVERIA